MFIMILCIFGSILSEMDTFLWNYSKYRSKNSELPTRSLFFPLRRLLTSLEVFKDQGAPSIRRIKLSNMCTVNGVSSVTSTHYFI